MNKQADFDKNRPGRVRVVTQSAPPGSVAVDDPKWLPRRDGKLQWLLPFQETIVCGLGSGATMAAQPQITFKPCRLSLLLPASHLDLVRVCSVKVGWDEVAYAYSGSPGVPARCFPVLPEGLGDAEKEAYEDLLAVDYGVVPLSGFILVHLVNDHEKEVRVRAVFWGVPA